VTHHPPTHVTDVLLAFAKICALNPRETYDELADHGVECVFRVDKFAANMLPDNCGDFRGHCRVGRQQRRGVGQSRFI
jgi:hypothetical protein